MNRGPQTGCFGVPDAHSPSCGDGGPSPSLGWVLICPLPHDIHPQKPTQTHPHIHFQAVESGGSLTARAPGRWEAESTGRVVTL